MISTRDKEESQLIKKKHFIEAITVLTKDVQVIEAEIESRLANVTRDKIFAYKEALNKLVINLRSISEIAFKETAINHVKTYAEGEKIPEDYRKYLNISNNLVDMILVDIFSQPSTNRMLFVMERWLYICSKSFSENDIFLAEKVIIGVGCHYLVTRSKIHDHLSDHAKGEMKKFNDFFMRVATVNQFHKEIAENEKAQCVPLLAALSHVLEALKVVDEKKNDEDKELSRASSRGLFLTMQEDLKPKMDDYLTRAYYLLTMDYSEKKRRSLHVKLEKAAEKASKKIYPDELKKLWEEFYLLRKSFFLTRKSAMFFSVKEEKKPDGYDSGKGAVSSRLWTV